MKLFRCYRTTNRYQFISISQILSPVKKKKLQGWAGKVVSRIRQFLKRYKNVNFAKITQFESWCLQKSSSKMKYIILLSLIAVASASKAFTGPTHVEGFPIYLRSCEERSERIRPTVRQDFNVAAVSAVKWFCVKFSQWSSPAVLRPVVRNRTLPTTRRTSFRLHDQPVQLGIH